MTSLKAGGRDHVLWWAHGLARQAAHIHVGCHVVLHASHRSHAWHSGVRRLVDWTFVNVESFFGLVDVVFDGHAAIWVCLVGAAMLSKVV